MYPDELLLGKNVPVADRYSPQLLYPIPRARGRGDMGLDGELPFHGADLWHAYELSWLDTAGKPQVRVGRFTIPVDSPNMVESKSFKLYLNSLNGTRFSSQEELASVLLRDISDVVGAAVGLEVLPVDAAELAGGLPAGRCLDDLDIPPVEGPPAPALLATSAGVVEESLHSHLLRSLCPVTGQPDWASVWIHYRGRPLDHASLLRYIVAYRRHQEFHEQCVERMFSDIGEKTAAELLEIQAFYTRRGGLDINPFRSTEPSSRPRPRMNRQ